MLWPRKQPTLITPFGITKRHVMFPVRNNKTFFFFEKASQGRTKLEEISIRLSQNTETLYSTKAVNAVIVRHNTLRQNK